MKAIVFYVLKCIPRVLANTFWYWHEQNRLAPNNINNE